MMGTLPTHHLMHISEEDCWLLFGKHAFKNADVLRAHPKHEVIGRKIARKCKGLPLAAKSLGGLLRSELDLEEWENILMSDIWELSDKEVNILPALWLSYHYLPSHLKRCFAYCSIFPKDYEFTQSEVILLWMSEDLIQPTERKMVEEVGKDCFNILISRSFFSAVTSGKHQSLFTMHDLINDLAKFVSGKFCFRLEDDDSLNIGSKTRHFSYTKTFFDDFEKFEALDKAKNLHTFLPLCDYISTPTYLSSMVVCDLLPRLQFLRVLDLSGYDIEELPSSISNLKHLRQLELSNSSIEKLPDTICDLYNLQTLVLWNCSAIVQLPNKLGRLINLRHLDIKGTCLEKMPPDMGKLKNLQLLAYFVLDKDTGHSIAELKELQYLSGTLSISGLHNVVSVKNALEANIRDKKYVKKLVLTWSGDSDDSQKDREVFDELQPHTNLQQLKIISYGGTRFPKWVGDDCFSNLISVTLMNCESCWFLPPLGQLPSLECLCIKGLSEVASIGAEFYGNGNTCGMKPFRSLKELRFEHMREWEDWSYVEGDEESGIFPNLCRLTLKDCPKLTQLLALNNFLKLEQLELQNLGSFSGSLSREFKCPKFFSLSSLEISDCPSFACFPNGGMNAPNLTKMVIHKCVKLRSLPEQMYTFLPSLQNISLEGCPELESFPEGGLSPALESLEFECYVKLFANRAKWGLQRLNSLRKLAISVKECGEVNSFPQEGMPPVPTTLTSLSIYNFQSLVTLEGKEFRHLSSLEGLVICGCPKLQCLPENGLPTSLSKLEIWGSPLLEQRLQREKGEDWPKISHIPWTNDFCWTET